MSSPAPGPNGSLRRLRITAGIVLTAIIAVMLLADAVAGSCCGIRADYRVEPVILGSLLGALLLLIGIEVGTRLPPWKP